MPDFHDYLRQEGRSRSMDHSPLAGNPGSGKTAEAMKTALAHFASHGPVFVADEILPTDSHPVYRLEFTAPVHRHPAVRFVGGDPRVR